MNSPRLLLLGTGVALFSACSVGPDYERPDLPVPDAWYAEATEDLQDGPTGLDHWWSRFGDPVLDALIADARAKNLDLRQAVLRIEEAMALRGVAASAYYGSVNGSANASATRSSAGTTPLPDGSDRTGAYYSLGIDVGWEADLWGRVRRSVESAGALLDASLEDYRDILVLVQAQVASTYVDIRTTQRLIALTEENIKLQQATLQLTRDRFDAGLVADLDVRRAELNLARTESTLPSLRAQLRASLNALAVLLGETPGTIESRLGDGAAIPHLTAPVTRGVPADLLRQRPDIRAAERRLAAQNARIGVAASDYYPRFILAGELRLESTDTGGFLSSDNIAYGFGPQVRWNLFNGGRTGNLVRAEEVRTQQAALAYEKTVLQALDEVETAMVAYQREIERNEALKRAVAAARTSVEQTQSLYKSGLTDFQNVLNMERDLFEQANLQAASEGAIAQYAISIFRALGGGWEDAATPAEPGR